MGGVADARQVILVKSKFIQHLVGMQLPTSVRLEDNTEILVARLQLDGLILEDECGEGAGVGCSASLGEMHNGRFGRRKGHFPRGRPSRQEGEGELELRVAGVRVAVDRRIDGYVVREQNDGALAEFDQGDKVVDVDEKEKRREHRALREAAEKVVEAGEGAVVLYTNSTRMQKSANPTICTASHSYCVQFEEQRVQPNCVVRFGDVDEGDGMMRFETEGVADSCV